jgi:hypothetical protein
MKTFFALLPAEEVAIVLANHVATKRGIAYIGPCGFQMMTIHETPCSLSPLQHVRIELNFPEDIEVQ